MSEQKQQKETDDVDFETLPTPVRRVNRTLAPSADALPMEWPTNLDLATVDGRLALANAGRVADWIPRDGGKYTIVAHHWIVYPQQMEDEESGEVKDITRVCLIDKDGNMVKFSSDFGPSALNRYVTLFTAEEWKRGIIFECESKKSKRSGKTYGDFRAVGIASNGETK